MVAHTRGGGPDSAAKHKLKFKEKLVGKGLATDALLKKLQALKKELLDLDQDQVDVPSLAAVRKELINTSLLLHKDRGVKAFVACCIADILRLYAPEAPYTQHELRDIFDFFFRQLAAGLKAADSPYYNEYFNLLESLSVVKSVVLVCDLPNPDPLIATIFKELFNIVRRDLPKKIEMFMSDILVALIDECQTLPQDVLEKYLLPHFMDKKARLDQAGYRLAVQVCNAAADKLQRHVCQYFTDLIDEHLQAGDFDEIDAAHELIAHLHRACPALLHNVIPQLEEELRAEEPRLRVLATRVLGEMLAEPKAGRDLARKYHSTWQFWVGRKNDKDAAVRLTWVETAKGLILNLVEERAVVEESLRNKLLDPDEKVRAAVCKVYSQLDYETALHHVTEEQLRAVANRGADKKNSVRVQALSCIGKLWSLAYAEIENNDPAAIKQFSWIPGVILQKLSIPDAKPAAEQVLAEHIFPLPSTAASSTSAKGQNVDEVAWTDRLLVTMQFLDDTATKALLTASGLKTPHPTIYDHYVQSCVKNNGGVIDADEDAVKHKLSACIAHIAKGFPLHDQQRVLDDLNTFAKLNEARLYKLLQTCANVQTDLKALVKATNDFRRRLEEESPSIARTMLTVLRRASLRIVNQSSIPTLLKRIRRDAAAADDADAAPNHNGVAAPSDPARALLAFVSKHCPALYQSHVGELTKAIADERFPTVTELGLQALAAVSRLDPSDKRTSERLMRYAFSSNERHAKFAARVLAGSKDSADLCEQLVDSIAEGLPVASPNQLVANLAVLAQIARLAPDAFEQKSDVITGFLIKQVLATPRPPQSNDDEDEWVPDEQIWPELRAKVLCLKVCRSRCLAHAADESAREVVAPVLKLCTTLLRHAGSLDTEAETEDDPRAKSRLRLQAAVTLLHLATVKEYAELIVKTSPFVDLAVTAQDPCFQVRQIFVSKLVGLLGARKLPSHFNTIPFLTVHDPEDDIPNMARSYVTLCLRNLQPARRVEQYEFLFLRFLHLLAHHPDFQPNHESLLGIAKYVEFYVDAVANADNVSLLYHLASRAKTVRDAESQAYSHNLYIISELTQELIKTRAQARSWPLRSYPGKVTVPGDILRPLPSHEAASKIVKQVFLPEETSTWLAERVKATSKDKPKAEKKAPAKRKAAVPRNNGHTKKRRRRKDDDESDDEDDDSAAATSEMDVDDAHNGKAHNSDVPDDEDGSSPTSPDRDERLGRGARTRAREKIKQQTKPDKSAKGREYLPSSDD